MLSYNIQAIKRGSLEKLQDSIQSMQECAGLYPSPKSYLDVCCILSVVSKLKGAPTFCYMTLLAHAAICKQRSMVEMLIKIGAGKANYTLVSSYTMSYKLLESK